jgi:hypothetical protein
MLSRRLNQGVLLWDRRGGVFSLKDRRESATGREGHADAGAESLPAHTPFF